MDGTPLIQKSGTTRKPTLLYSETAAALPKPSAKRDAKLRYKAAIQSLSLARRAAHNQALPPLTYGLLK
jgi:hypothetical protein